MATKKKTSKTSIDPNKHASIVIKTKLLTDLKAHPRNPRVHPERGSAEWNALKKSLEQDYFDPIVWNKRNGMLVSGHLRTKVLMDSGFTHADAVIVDYDEQMHIARMISANKLQGQDDMKALKDLLEEIDDGAFDLDMTGFNCEELEDLIAPMTALEPEKPEVEFTEELMEAHNYVVLYFDNEVDWLQCETLLGLKPVKALFSKEGFVKQGVGRVINGMEAINKIRNGLQ